MSEEQNNLSTICFYAQLQIYFVIVNVVQFLVIYQLT